MSAKPSSSPRSIPPVSLQSAALRDALERHRASLLERLRGGEDGVALGRANARFLNACFRLLFEGAARRVGLPRGVALAASGSFGRGAVAVRSDADVILLIDPARVPTKEAAGIASALLYPLWDAKLSVGHQVLGAADAIALAREDLTTATELLDLRLLGGDESLFRSTITTAREGLFVEQNLGSFLERLEKETAARHERFGGSYYLLEPELKNAAGGVRDIDGARWAACARFHLPTAVGPEAATPGLWGELVRLGALVGREADEIAEAEEFLWRLRNRLHARSARKTDRLGFDDQEALAVDMGFGGAGADRVRGAEALMQRFYLAARTILRIRSKLLDRIRPERRRSRPAPPIDLGGGVQMFEGHVTVSHTTELQTEPALALRVLMACVRHRAPILPFARDAITRAADDPAWCEALRASAEAASLFAELVCMVPEARVPRGSIAGEMHDLGLLVAMVPEFIPVTGRVHHDVYHVYTVDVHSVAAVDRLRQLARGELAAQYPLASRLAAEIARPRPLFFATLLHDIGKGWPDENGSTKNHSETGERLCERILPRLGFGAEETAEVCRLVRDHLLMYGVATRRDLDDPSTIETFSRTLAGREGLRDLYLLTVADVSTTSPTALTSWKARMLEELYFRSEGYLTGAKAQADAERVRRVYEAACALWVGPIAPFTALLACLPERYLLANRPESIVQHARVVADRRGRPVHVALVPSRHPEAAELCVVADDRPGLLASIAAALTANRLEVLTAEVYSHPVGAEQEALDLFWLRDRDGGTTGVEQAMPRLARDVEDLCSDRITASALVQARIGSSSPWSERPSPPVPAEVLFDDRASARHTIVEVFAKDRPGLLYTVAQTLHDLNLQIILSKINTEGARVADVFYVCEIDGQKVAPGARHAEIQGALLRVLAPPG